MRGKLKLTNLKFEIIEEIGVIKKYPNGWRKELNLISWNNRDPKYDIRDWSEGHEKMGKGVTLSADELKELHEILEWMEQ